MVDGVVHGDMGDLPPHLPDSIPDLVLECTADADDSVGGPERRSKPCSGIPDRWSVVEVEVDGGSDSGSAEVDRNALPEMALVHQDRAAGMLERLDRRTVETFAPLAPKTESTSEVIGEQLAPRQVFAGRKSTKIDLGCNGRRKRVGTDVRTDHREAFTSTLGRVGEPPDVMEDRTSIRTERRGDAEPRLPRPLAHWSSCPITWALWWLAEERCQLSTRIKTGQPRTHHGSDGKS